MKQNSYLQSFIFVFLLSNCGQGDRERSRQSESAPSTAMADSTALSSVAAESKGNDLFIRTADLKFEVQNVRQATFAIEDIVRQYGGYVSFTRLESEKMQIRRVVLSEDSVLEITDYRVFNEMSLRIPNHKLDSTLRTISPLVVFLDFRNITATDMGLEILTKQLESKRLSKHETRLENAIDNKGQKLNQIADTEDKLLENQTQADQSQIEKQKIMQDIAYSTVKMYIYQPAQTRKQMLENMDNTDRYDLPFFTKLADSFSVSWKAFLSLVLWAVRIWWILLVLGVAGFWFYKKYVK